MNFPSSSEINENILLEQQADLVAANNLLERKIFHFKVLIDFIKLIRFDLEEYSVLNNLLQVITKKLNYEYAFHYTIKNQDCNLSLTVQSDINPKVKLHQLPSFSLDLPEITNSSTYSFWRGQEANSEPLKNIYLQAITPKIYNITQIKISINNQQNGIIHLLNGGLEDRIGDDQLEILSLLIEHYQKQVENIFLYQVSVIDERTQLFNVRYFNQRIKAIIDNYTESRLLATLIIIDIDHFKKFNDSYGHQAGDLVLFSVAQEIKRSCRNFDLVARYGGEEFVVLLTKSNSAGALMVAERIRQNVENLQVDYQNKRLQVTISLGVAFFPGEAQDPASLISLADQALYQAKNRGRNQVVISQESCA